MKRSISGHFERVLDAPLVNINWSWGAQRKSDGAVFLRCWSRPDELRWKERRAMVGYLPTGSDDGRLGWAERQRHLALLESGVPGYLVLLHEKPDAEFVIGDFVDDRVWPITRLEMDEQGRAWAIFADAVAI
jgi:hypothetical protein